MTSPHWFYRIVMPWVVGLFGLAMVGGLILGWMHNRGAAAWVCGVLGILPVGLLCMLLSGRLAFCSRGDAARMKAEGFDVTVPRLSFYGMYNPRELKNADSPTLVENPSEK